MIVLSAKNITKTYGADVVLDQVSFHVNEKDRVGIIGANGAGKTTLMKILAGELLYDEGDCFISADVSIGYLKQNDSFNSSNTVIEEVKRIFAHIENMERDLKALSAEITELSESGGATENREKLERLLVRYDELQKKYEDEGGYSYKGEIKGILKSMAFGSEFYDKKIDTLSGGERTRLALACILLKKPQILFLDEPTNHLDIGTLKWLEQHLKTYRGTILMVSHDRYFLDRIANRIFEIENHRLYVYEGRYSKYAAQKRQLREARMRKYQKQHAEIKRQEDMIRRFKARGTEKLAKRAKSREKRLEQMEMEKRPEEPGHKMKIVFKENYESGGDVLYGENISKGFGYGTNRRELFQNVNFDIKKGEKICIIGPNGIGKTTLLRIMMGEIHSDRGRLKVGHNVEFAYYDQSQERLIGNNTLLDEMKESYKLYSDTEMRSILGRFLFTNDTVFLPVGALSGGERARLALVKIMLSGANTLILDEPTNHLDIESKEVFEEALMEFPGTCIIVSHDRYFLNKVPTRIFELQESGISNYLGKYDYYVEKKKESIGSGKAYLKKNLSKDTTVRKAEEKGDYRSSADTLSSAEMRRRQKKKEAEERRFARNKVKLEKEIGMLEDEIGNLEGELIREEVATDYKRLAEISEELKEKRKLMDEKYELWIETDS